MHIVKKVNYWVQQESARSNKNKVVVLINFVIDYFNYGVNPKEYFIFHFDGKTSEQKTLTLQSGCLPSS